MRGGNTPLRHGIALHVARQLLKTCFRKLVCRSPGIGWKEAREKMAAKASPRLFRPWGARYG
jgi:hypothetical protein